MRPLYRKEAICARRSPVLKGFKDAPVSGGGSLCRMIILLYAEGIEGGSYVERRPQCRREEAPVPPRGGPVTPRGGPCAERRPSVLRGLEEFLCREKAPVPKGGPLCRKVFCAERIGGGPCVGRRPLCREVALCPGRYCPLR